MKIVTPVLLLAAGAYGAWWMIESRPDVETRPPARVVPMVRVMPVRMENRQLRVISQGTVVPRTESDLVAEVAGRVTFVSPALAAGGFFEDGELLLTIDRADYELALSRAEAEIAQALLRLEQEKAEAEVARREWEQLGSLADAPPLVLRRPQLIQVETSLGAAQAAFEQARRDLERTEVRAPYAGRVRQKSVDVGQYVARGARLARIYAVDVAEIRLPLPDRELAFIDLALSHRGGAVEWTGPEVLVRTEFAGRLHAWRGRIARTEGEIDPQTRMVYVVAQVSDPYGPGADSSRPPLAVGMFVEAEILGRWVNRVVVLPRTAVRDSGQVYVVDSEGTLRFREVEVLRWESEQVIVSSGLREGEMVCLSPLETAVDGMAVEVAGEETP